MSEAESDQQLGEFLRKKAAAEKGLAELESKLLKIADRFQQVAANLKGYVRRSPGVDVHDDQDLNTSLRFGPESGVNVDELIQMLQERDRLAGTVKDCESAINKRLPGA